MSTRDLRLKGSVTVLSPKIRVPSVKECLRTGEVMADVGTVDRSVGNPRHHRRKIYRDWSHTHVGSYRPPGRTVFSEG